MKCISLWQPWASAIALGHKRVETRSWSTPYRGPIAIHAAKRWDVNQRAFHATEVAVKRLPAELPFGAIVAVAVLTEIVPIGQLRLLDAFAMGCVERLYGDYSDGRFGWVLHDIKALADPVPFKGMQGLFDVPDELLVGAKVRAA